MLALLASLALGTAARAESLPALPVMVSLSHEGGTVCGSADLASHLDYRFLRVVPRGQGDDLQLTCSERSDEVILDVRAGARGIGRFRVERSPSSPARTTAYLAAHAVAKDREVIAAALDAFTARNALLAENAASDLLAERWSYAAAMFARGLESDIDPSVLYFGLYKAEAGAGHPARAKWYLAAFLTTQRKGASDLSDDQAAPLARVLRSGAVEDASRADGDFAQYQDAASARDWHRALSLLHRVVEEAPWYEPAYVSLARSYESLGWDHLAAIWKKRAALVGRMNKDAVLGREIEARVDDVP